MGYREDGHYGRSHEPPHDRDGICSGRRRFRWGDEAEIASDPPVYHHQCLLVDDVDTDFDIETLLALAT